MPMPHSMRLLAASVGLLVHTTHCLTLLDLESAAKAANGTGDLADSSRPAARSVRKRRARNLLDLKNDTNDTNATNATEDVEWVFMHEHRPRLIFIAALEGAGTRVFQELWKRSFEYYDDHWQHVLKLNDSSWQCGHNWSFTDYDHVVRKMRTVKVKDICALPFQNTYPSCGVKAHNHPDRLEYFHPMIEWLVHAAKEAGADLEIIFMRRSVEDSLRYSCENQHYEINCALQAETLIANTDILLYQLGEVLRNNTNKLSCFNYTGDAEVQADVRRVFHPPLPNIDHEFERRDITHLPQLTDAMLQGQLAKVHEKTAELDEMCAKMSPFTMEDYRRFVEVGHGWTDRLHILTPQR